MPAMPEDAKTLWIHQGREVDDRSSLQGLYGERLGRESWCLPPGQRRDPLALQYKRDNVCFQGKRGQLGLQPTVKTEVPKLRAPWL